MSRTRRQRLAERLRREPPAIYGLLDAGIVPLESWADEAAALAASGIEILQLRAKKAGAREFRPAAQAVIRCLETTEIPILVNDRVDVAIVAGAHGVHLGLEDLPTAAARELLGEEMVIGATAHSLEEIAALDPRVVDYVGFGAMFVTATREGVEIRGPQALTRAVAASTLPIVAIGGINPGNVDSLRDARPAAVAVAGAITPHRACPGAIESLRSAIAAWPRPAR